MLIISCIVPQNPASNGLERDLGKSVVSPTEDVPGGGVQVPVHEDEYRRPCQVANIWDGPKTGECRNRVDEESHRFALGLGTSSRGCRVFIKTTMGSCGKEAHLLQGN